MQQKFSLLVAVSAIGIAITTAPPAWAQLDLKGEAWAAYYNGPASLNDGPGDGYKCSRVLASSPDSQTVYVAGTTNVSSTAASYLVLAYDAISGAQRWVATFPGLAAYPFGDATAIVVSPDGSAIFVTGASFNDSAGAKAMTFRVDANTGAIEWTAESYLSFPQDIAISPDGGKVYACGGYETIAYDSVSGAQLWQAPFVHGPNNRYTFVQRVAANPDGTRVYVAGAEIAESGNTDEFILYTYDASNGQLLNMSHHASNGFPPRGLVVSPDGRRVFTTFADFITGFNSAYTTAYDAEGNELWHARFEGLCNAGNAQCTARPGYSNPVTVSPDGTRLYVTMVAVDFPNEWFNTVAYDAVTGAQLWTAARQVGAEDPIKGPVVTVNPDGKEVYVSGSGDGFVTTTVAYDAQTGAEHWHSLHEIGFPVAIAPGPDGSSVFVAGGERRVGGTDFDVYTLRYDTGLPAPVRLNSVASRLSHSGIGEFDIQLPGIGMPAVECRRSGPDGGYKLVFAFDDVLDSVGSARLAEGIGTISGSYLDRDAHNYIVNVTGLTNEETVTITIDNVTDRSGRSSAAVSRSVSLLLGDINADGAVNSADISQVKSRSGMELSDANFRVDLNLDGAVNSGDISLAKSMSGTGLSASAPANAASRAPTTATVPPVKGQRRADAAVTRNTRITEARAVPQFSNARSPSGSNVQFPSVVWDR